MIKLTLYTTHEELTTIREGLKAITTFVDVLTRAEGAASQPQKPTKKQLHKLAASKMASGERLTTADLKELNEN